MRAAFAGRRDAAGVAWDAASSRLFHTENAKQK